MKDDPVMYHHVIFRNEHLDIWMHINIADGTRTHYFNLTDKIGKVEHEIEFTDKELDEFVRKVQMYRYAKRD